MRVPLKWLKEYVDITLPSVELATKLTEAGLEVGEVIISGGRWEGVRIGKVLDVQRHPNADRLTLATVDLGQGQPMTVVCGAPNVAAGQKVAFAREGAVLLDGRSGQPTSLKRAVIRGVESAGMICSEKELGLSDNHEGILVLPEDAPLGDPLAFYLGDTIFDFDLRPNRPDCLSVLGIAREVAAITGVQLREPSLDYPEEGPAARGRATVQIADRDLCPRYCAALVEGLTIGSSPPWMQERLTAAGLRPINNVVDVTNYVALELGQPLHAFDFNKIGARKIVVRRTKAGERLLFLDGSERALSPDMLVIADAEVPLALAGIMGGLKSEVDAKTTTVLLESANFSGPSIRRASSALKMRTEASLRFEKGMSRELPMVAARRAAKLLVELCGGVAAKGIIDVYPGKQSDVRITVTQERLRKVLGIALPVTEVRRTLMSLGFSCRYIPPDRYVVRVPHWRTDVRIPDDVAEELARIYGYNRLPSTALRGAIPAAEPQPLYRLREQVRDVLVAAGLQEVIHYSLTSLEALQRVLSPQDLERRPPLVIANPMSEESKYLRTSLRASMLQSLERNLRQRPNAGLFEIGRVYLPQADDLPEEREMTCGVVCGPRPDRWGRPYGEPFDFYDAKAYMERVLQALALQAEFIEASDFAFLPGRTAAVTLSGQQVGLVGEVHPDVAASFDIAADVAMFELDLASLLPHVSPVRRYQAIPRFPRVEQDIALIVDEGIAAERVKAMIEDSSLVSSASLFDIYTGPPIPAGKKSLAFSVSYRSPDHTLTDSEVSREQERIVERLKRELGAVLRGEG